MKKHLLSLLLLAGATSALAQNVATFEDLPLPGPDTFYINHSAAAIDVGFNDRGFHFPTVFDSASGMWYQSSGFVYSNIRDSVTPGFSNQYAAIAGSGYMNSEKYAVAYYSPWTENYFLIQDTTDRKLSGAAITNNTYAYLSMRDGDFIGKKFGGPTGDDPDYFRVIFKGYKNGMPAGDSVVFYLADFRYADNSQDYIVKSWGVVALAALGVVDSVTYVMESSDMGVWGINTPTYFCLDNLMFEPLPAGVPGVTLQQVKFYPNPARAYLTLESPVAVSYQITDMLGRPVSAGAVQAGAQQISVQELPAGIYLLLVQSGQSFQNFRFRVEK